MDFMLKAFELAKKAYNNQDVPVGAVIVKNNKIISKGYNQKEKKKNVVKHAEIIAIEKACKKLKSWHLDDCILYVTMEPCLMCAGAIMQSRIKKVIYATENEKFGSIKIIKENSKVIVEKGNYEDESKTLLKRFFADKR